MQDVYLSILNVIVRIALRSFNEMETFMTLRYLSFGYISTDMLPPLLYSRYSHDYIRIYTNSCGCIEY
jgi:hypothetical protein